MITKTEKLKSGITIGFYTRIITQLTNFIFGIILARLLTPEDYGVIGVLAIFLVIIDQFIDSGFGIALLQQKKVIIKDYNSVFTFNLIIAILLYIIFFFSAHYIANFYDNEKLVSIVKVMGLVSIIKALGATQGAYLNKCQHYVSQAKVYYISLIIGSIAAVVFATLGFSFWALIIKSLLTTTFLTIGWWYVSPWKPKLIIFKSSLIKLFSFGSKLLVTSLFDNIFRNLYSLIIGKFFNVQILGYYNRAKNFTDLPDNILRQSVMNKIFPVFSYFQDNDEKLKIYYKKILVILTLIFFPLYTVLYFVSYPLIVVLLTTKWLAAAPLLQILCFKALFIPFETINGNIVLVKGKSSYMLVATFLRRIIFIILIITLYKYGIKALLWGLVIDSFITSLLYYYFSQKVFSFNIWEQLLAIKNILIFLIPYILVLYFISTIHFTSFYKLVVTLFTGGIIYSIFFFSFYKKELFAIINILNIKNIF